MNRTRFLPGSVFPTNRRTRTVRVRRATASEGGAGAVDCVFMTPVSPCIAHGLRAEAPLAARGTDRPVERWRRYAPGIYTFRPWYSSCERMELKLSVVSAR